MYVSKLVVKGYRSLADVEINFNPGIDVIVGKNNAGKSNIIRALNSILGERHPSYVRFENRDFYSDGSDSVHEIIIAARLNGSFEAEISSSRRTKVLELDPGFTPSWNKECIEKIADESFSVGYAYKYPSEIVDEIKNSPERWIFLYAKKDEDSANTYGLIYKENGKWYRTTLTKEIRDSLITTAYVPSYRDPEKMLKITEYTWYGKLIKQIYEKGLRDREIEIREIQERHSDKINEIFHEASEELRKRLRRAVFHHKISFKPGPYIKDDEHKSITLFVNDGLDTPYYDKGSGIQSALVIALFAYYCERFHKGSSLLLLEEPENYLHPQGRRALEGELLRFVEERSNGERQVILSTHSPEFLRSDKLGSLIRVHKKPGSTDTELFQIDEEEMDDETKRKFKQIMMQKGVEMFFADGAILVEGGEEHLLPQLFDIFANERRWLDSRDISVVRVDGKKSFKNYTGILDKIGIWWIILTDLDFLYDGLNRSGYLSDPGEIELIREIANEVERYAEEETREMSNPHQKRKEKKMKRMEKLKSVVEEREDVKRLIHRLRENGIFILFKGELEDCLTEQAMQLDDSSKDRRALELALILSKIDDESELSEWFVDVDEFKDLFEAVGGKVVI
ncbi:MAG: chromosome segregation protein SMC [Candidatus Syntrophoarchaeum butanivorans]|uniref:Chromosome segregation protein SMC n=1 Tax=Candidatus Syntropharchaeum butanivorans TaxID=1839936 RepID=A0A1F2P8N1_9EURY|nr:MAG: chromosome segregation protein SMC [Candidatus Syntrophoarchaeum butanivorans]